VNTRREFLSSVSGAGLSVPLLAARGVPPKSTSPNGKIQIALIGSGGMGQEDARSSVASGITKLVAACDCYDGRLEHMKEQYGRDIFTTKRYEEILTRKDIDAVIIGTPDHWHQRITLDALAAKKDVYCEKPMVQHIDDGLAVVQAHNRSNRIVQIGSQRVSSVLYKKAQQLFRSGAIGKLNMVEAWWDRNSAVGSGEYVIPPDANTATCDWDRFQGRAPRADWDPKKFFRWRCYREYGTGVAGDLFVHLFSGLHFITGAQGPRRVFATGGLRFWKDGRNVPDFFIGVYDYPDTPTHPAFNLILRVNFVNGATEDSGFRFTGSDGIMTVGRTVTLSRQPQPSEPGYTIDTFSQPVQDAFLKHYRARYPETKPSVASIQASRQEIYEAPEGYSDHRDHHLNFALAIRSRRPVVEDPIFGFRAAGPALLSNISYFENRIVRWNPAAMKIEA
jgi:predicted dehydrogenase